MEQWSHGELSRATPFASLFNGTIVRPNRHAGECNPFIVENMSPLLTLRLSGRFMAPQWSRMRQQVSNTQTDSVHTVYFLSTLLLCLWDVFSIFSHLLPIALAQFVSFSFLKLCIQPSHCVSMHAYHQHNVHSFNIGSEK